MPTHWTYDPLDPEEDLYQGDIIGRSDHLLKVLRPVHGYFCDPKYLGFLVISQTCDLVVRGGECKTRYINLAVIRSLDDVIPDLLDEECGTPIPGVLSEDKKSNAKQLIERIINQNEQAHGMLYLHPDGDVQIGVPSIALLRVSIALRAKTHYRTLKDARVKGGRLAPSFRNKLGWLTGNLYSRVDTVDWPEKEGRNNAKKRVDELFDGVCAVAKRIWVPQSWVHAAESKKIDFTAIPADQVLESLKAHAPTPPFETAIASVQSAAESLLIDVKRDQITEIAGRLRSDRAFQVLIANAVSEVAGRHLPDGPVFFQLLSRLNKDERFKALAADSTARFAQEFATMRGVAKKLSVFLDLFAKRSLFDETSFTQVVEVASDLLPDFSGKPIESLAADLGTMTPTGAITDLVHAMSYEVVCRSMPTYLVSRLKNDTNFRGSIKKDV